MCDVAFYLRISPFSCPIGLSKMALISITFALYFPLDTGRLLQGDALIGTLL